jgi:hypothetical protein
LTRRIVRPGIQQLAIRLCFGGRKGSSSPSRATGFFRDRKLEEVVRSNQSLSPDEFSEQLLSQIDQWRSVSTPQQDDMTLVVIDVGVIPG